LQTAAGVPLQCDERPDFRTFRIGLFGLEKLEHVDRTVQHLAAALEKIVEAEAVPA
jgi:aspartate aminotransferase-like enzyme